MFVIAGLFVLWHSAHRQHLFWSNKLLAGTLLMGFGLFNRVEGLVDHQILGVHHINEQVPRAQWAYRDVGLLIWGAAMLSGGWAVVRDGKRDIAATGVEG